MPPMRVGGPILLFFLLFSGAVSAAELVLFETASCAWCIKWDRDVGRGYDRTRAARLMPLRRIDVRQPVPPDMAALGVAALPTFVVTECGREVGRITGYADALAFWRGLEGIARRLRGGC